MARRGVAPYYLTTKAERGGYHPEVILAGRRINDGMGAFIAQKTVKLLLEEGRSPVAVRAKVLGLTFKENVGDLRNSRVPDIVHELQSYVAHVTGIARALYHQPPIIVFDEATGALDVHTERRVFDALDAIAKERTLVRIAHRLETIMNAAIVVVLDGGRVIDRGQPSTVVRRYREVAV